MLITEQERKEGQLIRITDQIANIALLPLTGPRETELRHLCAKVEELLGSTAAEGVDGSTEGVGGPDTPGGFVMGSYPEAWHAVREVTGCHLPSFLYDHAVKHIRDPQTRVNFMFNAAISYDSGDVENLIEDEIDAYLEDVAAEHAEKARSL